MWLNFYTLKKPSYNDICKWEDKIFFKLTYSCSQYSKFQVDYVWENKMFFFFHIVLSFDLENMAKLIGWMYYMCLLLCS